MHPDARFAVAQLSQGVDYGVNEHRLYRVVIGLAHYWANDYAGLMGNTYDEKRLWIQ